MRFRYVALIAVAAYAIGIISYHSYVKRTSRIIVSPVTLTTTKIHRVKEVLTLPDDERLVELKKCFLSELTIETYMVKRTLMRVKAYDQCKTATRDFEIDAVATAGNWKLYLIPLGVGMAIGGYYLLK